MTLLELIRLNKKHIKFVIAVPLICAVLVGIYSFVGMPSTYTATTSLYVLAGQDETGGNLSTSLSTSQLVANDVATLLRSNRVRNQAEGDLELRDFDSYSIAVESDASSRIIEISVTGTNAEDAAAIANAMADNAVKVSKDVMKIEAVNIIDRATAPTASNGSSRALYIVSALMGGLFIAVTAIVAADMLNTRVRKAEEVEELLDIPVIGRIPTLKGGN